MTTAAELDPIGQVIDGKYRVDQPLGRGGMGAVFRATHLGTDRTVALKVIQPALAADPAYLERFRREARACGRLRHQNIVDVTDFGVCRVADRELAYLVMEYLDGCTLAEVLEAEPVPPLPWTIDILEQVCEAVEAAHRQGILHRDLKPENVWLEPNRRGGYSVKVLDFGLARLGSDTKLPSPADRAGGGAIDHVAGTIEVAPDSAVTIAPLQSGAARTTVAGTPGYMSPEQASAGEVTARTDVYSLGVIAFRMLTGREPFVGSVRDVMHAHVHTPPPSIRVLAPSVSADAADLVAAALAKDPAMRPASAGRFGNMLTGRLEPAGTSLRKALGLVLDRLPVFVTIAVVCFLPALALSVALTGWTAAQAASLLPLASRPAVAAALVALLFITLLGAFALGVMPVVVLHALAAPQRPIDLAALRRVYDARVRAWLRAMAPIVWPQVLALLIIALSILAMSSLRPWIRSLSPPMRLPVIFGILAPGFILQWWAILRLGARLQGAGFIGPVMLVEGLGFEAARTRAIALAANAGRLQRRGRSVTMIAMVAVSMVAGFFFSRLGLSVQELAAAAPLLVMVAMAGMTMLSVVSSLGYFTARRAMGESLDRALEDFERAVLPETHWRRSHREQVMGQLSSGAGSSAAATRITPPEIDSQAETREI